MADSINEDDLRALATQGEQVMDLFHTGVKALEAGFAQHLVVDGRTVQPTEIPDRELRDRLAKLITRVTLVHSVLDAEMEGPTVGEVLAGETTTDTEELVGFDIVGAAEAALRGEGEEA